MSGYLAQPAEGEIIHQTVRISSAAYNLALTIISSSNSGVKSFSIHTSRTQGPSLFVWLICLCGSQAMRVTHGLSLCQGECSSYFTTTGSVMIVLSSSRIPTLSTIQLTLDEI